MAYKSDQKLINDYLKGDAKSLEILIGRHLGPVYGFVRRRVGNSRDAEDLTQEVFLRAWRGLKKTGLRRFFSGGFNPEKGNFRTWIFGIARNASIDFLRKSRLASGERKEIPFSEFSVPDGNAVADTLADSGLLPSEIIERVDVGRDLAAALEKIPSEYRMVLRLRHNGYLTFREIGEALGQSLNTVKSRHRRALAMLKKVIPGP